jgi:hypothetical protein
MLTAQSSFNTAKATAYLKKFCRHFAHKLPTEFDDVSGYVDFPFGDCRLVSQDDQLMFKVEAETEESLAKMEDVVARHMERFAFRDGITLMWVRQ